VKFQHEACDCTKHVHCRRCHSIEVEPLGDGVSQCLACGYMSKAEAALAGPDGRRAPDWHFVNIQKLHTFFNVAIRREGGVAPACDGPDCVICKDIAREFEPAAAPPERSEP